MCHHFDVDQSRQGKRASSYLSGTDLGGIVYFDVCDLPFYSDIPEYIIILAGIFVLLALWQAVTRRGNCA